MLLHETEKLREAEVEHNGLWDRVIRRHDQRIYSWIEHGIDYTVSQYLFDILSKLKLRRFWD